VAFLNGKTTMSLDVLYAPEAKMLQFAKTPAGRPGRFGYNGIVGRE
jgi:hypothetical protein